MLSQKDIKIKGDMIQDILICIKAGGCYMGGDILIALAFRTIGELKAIKLELHIK